MNEPEHVRRGAFLERDVVVPGAFDQENRVLNEFHCAECDSLIRLRNRTHEANYVRLGCECGAAELALWLAGDIEGGLSDDGIAEWEARRKSEVFDDAR